MEAAYTNGDVVAYYWNAYFEWRVKCTLADDSMSELVVAIRADIDSGSVAGKDAARLKKLARMIELEFEGPSADDAECAA